MAVRCGNVALYSIDLCFVTWVANYSGYWVGHECNLLSEQAGFSGYEWPV